MYKCGLIVGRFHNVTIGHENLIESALKVCERVLVFIGSAQESGTKKNPFKVETRLEMLRAIYKDNDRVIVEPLNDLTKERRDTNNTKWGDYLLENAKNILGEVPDCIICGLASDEVVRVTGWFDVDAISNTSFLLVPRSIVSISGTEVRELLKNDNKKEWEKWTNKRIHYMYNKLRKELSVIEED